MIKNLGRSERLAYTMINDEIFVECKDANNNINKVIWNQFVFREKYEMMRNAIEFREDHLATCTSKESLKEL